MARNRTRGKQFLGWTTRKDEVPKRSFVVGGKNVTPEQHQGDEVKRYLGVKRLTPRYA